MRFQVILDTLIDGTSVGSTDDIIEAASHAEAEQDAIAQWSKLRLGCTFHPLLTLQIADESPNTLDDASTAESQFQADVDEWVSSGGEPPQDTRDAVTAAVQESNTLADRWDVVVTTAAGAQVVVPLGFKSSDLASSVARTIESNACLDAVESQDTCTVCGKPMPADEQSPEHSTYDGRFAHLSCAQHEAGEDEAGCAQHEAGDCFDGCPNAYTRVDRPHRFQEGDLVTMSDSPSILMEVVDQRWLVRNAVAYPTYQLRDVTPGSAFMGEVTEDDVLDTLDLVEAHSDEDGQCECGGEFVFDRDTSKTTCDRCGAPVTEGR